MDFMAKTLADGRPFRPPRILDEYSRECPAIEVSHSLPATRVTRALGVVAMTRGLPEETVIDNGPE